MTPAYRTPSYPNARRDEAARMHALWPNREPPAPPLWRRGLLLLAWILWCTVPFALYMAVLVMTVIWLPWQLIDSLVFSSSSVGDEMDDGWDRMWDVLGWWPGGFRWLRGLLLPEA